MINARALGPWEISSLLLQDKNRPHLSRARREGGGAWENGNRARVLMHMVISRYDRSSLGRSITLSPDGYNTIRSGRGGGITAGGEKHLRISLLRINYKSEVTREGRMIDHFCGGQRGPIEGRRKLRT